ncbi:MAG: hypothetical protein LBU27_09230 [Candidatus Peribacteria bacterium]|jgi:hypothetical protein|nr:hypothetical protein [Candidatus Peribacteria bacterium]
MIFSCPPYVDLEKYSDNPEDLSNMEYQTFLSNYTEIITQTLSLLKDNRFAVFVVGEVRDRKTGFYYPFVEDTKRIFRENGADFYNDIILLNQL